MVVSPDSTLPYSKMEDDEDYGKAPCRSPSVILQPLCSRGSLPDTVALCHGACVSVVLCVTHPLRGGVLPFRQPDLIISCSEVAEAEAVSVDMSVPWPGRMIRMHSHVQHL